MSQAKFDIYDIMACNVYWDYGTPGLAEGTAQVLGCVLCDRGEVHARSGQTRSSASAPTATRRKIQNQKFTGEYRELVSIYDSDDRQPLVHAQPRLALAS